MKTKNEVELNLFSIATEYSDNDKARELLESLRWPNGPVCPHCKGTKAYRLTPKANSKTPARKGLCKCATCRKMFSVTVGTIFEGSHIPLGKWLMAVHLLCASKKAMSAHQLHRMLGVTYKTAWFMAHRLRYAFGTNPFQAMLKGQVELDETYVGGVPRAGDKRTGGYRKDSSKVPVVALIERGGEVRVKVVPNVTQKNLRSFIDKNISKEAHTHTDQARVYHTMLYPMMSHNVTNHNAKEYARKLPSGELCHVNTCESFFSLLKRGIMGSFHCVSDKHLHRYCDEFAFRWNTRKLTDSDRTKAAIQTIEGKRLTYRQAQ